MACIAFNLCPTNNPHKPSTSQPHTLTLKPPEANSRDSLSKPLHLHPRPTPWASNASHPNYTFSRCRPTPQQALRPTPHAAGVGKSTASGCKFSAGVRPPTGLQPACSAAFPAEAAAAAAAGGGGGGGGAQQQHQRDPEHRTPPASRAPPHHPARCPPHLPTSSAPSTVPDSTPWASTPASPQHTSSPGAKPS